ncbi:Leucine Rich Repeat [Seminavis robusta]|uniref:Leucine Rich Repeat n=1 Tax=Seminavis robusta TaxID=568900 RepID=A0A9N8DCW3_9STRA|nr:Leucine Rich Repeat [Seminavis robusta]|eukprot:Sro19_g013250.1 Leucine Rich Repeat (710) ;mRNA; f:21810-23939
MEVSNDNGARRNRVRAPDPPQSNAFESSVLEVPASPTAGVWDQNLINLKTEAMNIHPGERRNSDVPVPPPTFQPVSVREPNNLNLATHHQQGAAAVASPSDNNNMPPRARKPGLRSSHNTNNRPGGIAALEEVTPGAQYYPNSPSYEARMPSREPTPANIGQNASDNASNDADFLAVATLVKEPSTLEEPSRGRSRSTLYVIAAVCFGFAIGAIAVAVAVVVVSGGRSDSSPEQQANEVPVQPPIPAATAASSPSPTLQDQEDTSTTLSPTAKMPPPEALQTNNNALTDPANNPTAEMGTDIPGSSSPAAGVTVDPVVTATILPSGATVDPSIASIVTLAPTISTLAPTMAPTVVTAGSTGTPSMETLAPAIATAAPTLAPTMAPTIATGTSTVATAAPSTGTPSMETLAPTIITAAPTLAPTMTPTVVTGTPTAAPSMETLAPTIATAAPTLAPTMAPTIATAAPSTGTPSMETLAPTVGHSSAPTIRYTTSPAVPDDGATLTDFLPDYSLEALQDPTTPQAFAILFVNYDPNIESRSPEDWVQRFALASVFLALGSSGGSWTEGAVVPVQDSCVWFEATGSYCNEDGQQEGLLLENNNLQGGPIPPEIGLLTSLRVVDMSDNTIAGGIPSHFGLLQELEFLSLANNRMMAGTVPPEISLIPTLTTLDLTGMPLLAGTIPVELCGIATFDCTGTLCGCDCACTFLPTP